VASLAPDAAHLLRLVQSALDDADDPATLASVALRKAVRIARLRDDWEAVWWLRLQTLNPSEQQTEYDELKRELLAYIPVDDWDATSRRVYNKWEALRARSDGMLQVTGLAELEIKIAEITKGLDALGDAPTDLRTALIELRTVVVRVRDAVASYLGVVETQLLAGRVQADVFERNLRFIEAELARIAPQALDQFAAANQRRSEGDAEALTHALTSCRRVLSTVADALYPATGETVVGIDGRPREMTADKVINRLSQFAVESAPRSASRDLVVEQVRALGKRLGDLISLNSKGVHADVTSNEVDLAITHTYAVVGDLLRLRKPA
jgi:hypothetical protein